MPHSPNCRLRQALTPGSSASSWRAAEVLLDKIKKLGKDVVRVGFGAGLSTQQIAFSLGRLMSSEGPLPKVVFHALTKGFHIHNVSYDPASFFSYLNATGHEVDFVGLSTAPLVAPGVPMDLDHDPSVLGDPFAEKWEIDIIVTALANYQDPNSEHRRLVHGCGMAEEAESKGVVGDVLYRAFNDEGMVEFETGKRVVTLFDLDELREFAAIPDKEVVLVSGPCGGEERTRHVALLPLLEKDNLRVWTHIVTDRETCTNLLAADGAAEQDLAELCSDEWTPGPSS